MKIQSAKAYIVSKSLSLPLFLMGQLKAITSICEVSVCENSDNGAFLWFG